MMKRMMGLMALVVSVVFMISCDGMNGDTSFKTTDSGLKYRMVVDNPDADTVALGEIVSLAMTYETEDSVLFNSDDIPDKLMLLQYQQPAYPGDFYEMLGMMHLGDSAVFMQLADSFFIKTAGAPMVPPEMQGKELTFKVKLVKIQSEQELQEEMMAKMELERTAEVGIIDAYIAENNINVEPTESGLYVVVTEVGEGPKPNEGDRVKVHYTGTLLDGTKFDSSHDRGQPYEFALGKRQVIAGWDEGIAMLNEGSKATLIIPSSLGYGERGSGRIITPFSPLKFDVELVEIVK
jgi:FKBP-type peptidyl-prolyl cis-trans isomerase